MLLKYPMHPSPLLSIELIIYLALAGNGKQSINESKKDNILPTNYYPREQSPTWVDQTRTSINEKILHLSNLPQK
ncbi:hypothetical protein M432DRAFT_614688 [Thermoascus aurantiacus ATCC 26904]